MMPVTPCSTNNLTLFPGSTFTSRRNYQLIRSSLLHKSTRQILSSQRIALPLSTSIRLLPTYTSGSTATGTDLAVEEPTSAIAAEDAAGASTDAIETTPSVEEAPTSAQTKRPRPTRKSDFPPVTNEELVPGATFTGKVRSIQPFGAFVDFGAFTDGLVHVSQLSDTFVKDVNEVVSLGQEVKVRLVEANLDSKRISLTMRQEDDISKLQQRRDSPGGSSDKSRPRRNTNQKTTKLVKGQDLQGTVKNTNRAGAFISLPDGEEGFLPSSEEYNEGFESMIDGSSMQIGEEVSVRVLRIARGQVTLTMKKEEEIADSNSKVMQGVVHTATNPFARAFRQNKDIAAFLDETVKVQKAAQDLVGTETSGEADVKVSTENPSEVPETAPVESDKEIEASDTSANASPTEETIQKEDPAESSTPEESVPTVEATVTDQVKDDVVEPEPEIEAEKDQELPAETVVVEAIQESQADVPISKDETNDQPPSIIENDTPTPTPSEDAITVEPISEENGSVTASTEQSTSSSSQEIPTKASISPALVKTLREETGAGMMDCKKALAETGGDLVKAQEFLRKKGLASADKKSSRVTAEGRIGSYIHDSRIGILIEVNCETDFVSRGDIFKELVDDLAMQVAACPQVEYLVTDDVDQEFVKKEREIEMQKEDLLSKPEQIREKIVDGRIRKRLEEMALLEQPYIKNDKMVVKDWVKQTIATIGENIKVKRFVRFNLGEGLEKKSQDFAAEVAAQTSAQAAPVAQPAPPVPAETKAVESAPKMAISAALVKKLREETGAGMMDCKKALAETEGDLEKAQEYLRKKGLSSAEKKSSRIAAEGRIGSYIHDARIGVLIEVNCETDFVGRSEKFKELVDDLAMQVVACPQVEYVSVDDIPQSIVAKEKEIEMQREDLQSKPENIREKIVEGRIGKRLGVLALLEQPYIKDDALLIKDLVKQSVASIGENIKIRRFARFTLGETKDDA
ncbi:hypothetical protein ACHQM5_028655 [Ranunculus cassubicifolius]